LNQTRLPHFCHALFVIKSPGACEIEESEGTLLGLVGWCQMNPNDPKTNSPNGFRKYVELYKAN